MLLITCPVCGPRDEIEFRSGGQGHLIRPGPAEAVTGDVWSDYLFTRVNPKGLHYERWVHAGGCGRWFNMARSTETHSIRAIYAMTDPMPEIEA